MSIGLQNMQYLRILCSKYPSKGHFANSVKLQMNLSRTTSLVSGIDFTERRVSLLFATLSSVAGKGVCSFRTDRINLEVRLAGPVDPLVLGLRSNLGAFRRTIPWVLQSADTGLLNMKSFSGGDLLRPFQKLFWSRGLDFYLQAGPSRVGYSFSQGLRAGGKYGPKLQEGLLRLRGVPARVARPVYLFN